MPLLSAAMVSGLAAWAGGAGVTVHGAVAMGLTAGFGAAA